MELRHISIENIHDTKLNMRHDRKPPDVSDILPTVKAKGILQPLLVRPYAEGGEGAVEIVAGRRRYWCGRAIVDEQGSFAPLPCAVMEPGDDASAIEASLIENAARRDADPMTEYVTFVRLIKEGRKVSEIAATFGITDIMVEQRLALGNLLPKIQDAYRGEEIDDETVRHLTMASKAQQKEWLKLHAEGEAPFGHQLKQWLFGGQEISTKVALFPLEEFKGHTIADLFGEDSYFADADLFWELQNAAIAAKQEALLDAGWSAVHILEVGEHFNSWELEKTPKTKGGHVFITVSHRGAVEIHDGWLSKKDARRAAKQPTKDAKPTAKGAAQITKTMENYLELHRHALVRLALIADPGVALRLMVAHAAAPSGNWQVKSDPQRTRNDDVKDSIARAPAQAAFKAERDQVIALFGLAEDAKTEDVFARVLALSDVEVLRVAALVMADTLAVGGASVDAAGTHLQLDARIHWQPDEAFFELARDRTTVNAMLAEIGGPAVAKANVAEKAKTQKKIIRDFLAGANGREKVEGWCPGWMAFPFRQLGEKPRAPKAKAEIVPERLAAE